MKFPGLFMLEGVHYHAERDEWTYSAPGSMAHIMICSRASADSAAALLEDDIHHGARAVLQQMYYDWLDELVDDSPMTTVRWLRTWPQEGGIRVAGGAWHMEPWVYNSGDDNMRDLGRFFMDYGGHVAPLRMAEYRRGEEMANVTKAGKKKAKRKDLKAGRLTARCYADGLVCLEITGGMEELWLKASDIGDFIDLAGSIAEHTGARETSRTKGSTRYTQEYTNQEITREQMIEMASQMPPGHITELPDMRGGAMTTAFRDGGKITMAVDPAFEPKPKESTGFVEWARKALVKAGFD